MTKILIVEDHALVREAMAQSLSRLESGVECFEAADGDEALAVLECHPDLDLAVVDLMLPDVNGFSLLPFSANAFPTCRRSWCRRWMTTPRCGGR